VAEFLVFAASLTPKGVMSFLEKMQDVLKDESSIEKAEGSIKLSDKGFKELSKNSDIPLIKGTDQSVYRILENLINATKIASSHDTEMLSLYNYLSGPFDRFPQSFSSREDALRKSKELVDKFVKELPVFTKSIESSLEAKSVSDHVVK